VQTADLALRSAAVGSLLLLGALMLRQWRARPVGWLGAALALGAICHLLCPRVVAAWGFGLTSLPLLVGCVGVPLLFRWFARALFEERFGWRASDALLAAAVLGFGLAEIHLAVGGACADPGLRMIIGFVAKLAALGTVAWTLVEAFTGRRADLVETRRRLRLQMVAALAAYMLVVIAAELYLLGAAAPPWVAAADGAGVLLLVIGLGLALLRARDDLVPGQPYRDVGPDAADIAIEQRLRAAMEQERLYREEGLSIAVLAARVGVQEYRLRRVINGQLGFRNFNDFLNRQRIAEACAALSDPTKARIPVLTIALEAGFGSLGPFNRAFKAQVGLTPTEYRRTKLAEVRES
jgi:AraC-like DNA-binding protein